jgi:predicted amidohydrolase
VAAAIMLMAGAAMSGVRLTQTEFTQAERDWRPTAAREEIQPACAVDAAVSRTGRGGSLRIACSAPVQYGGWTRTITGLTPKAWYRFEASYRAAQVQHESRAVVARLDWRNAQGERVGQPDYAYHIEEAGGGWKRLWAVAPAPEGAAAVRLELLFGWSPGGTVWWDDIGLAETPPPAPRPVRIATIRHEPHGNASPQQNIEEFCAWIDRAAESKPDIVVLPEAMTAVGTGLSYAAVAEPIPGPTSERLGREAREHHCYLVACYDERDGAGVFNTAVLIDRQGKLVGKYRKAYLPREEIEAGLTPGDETPVFETDFGSVGMMICWDVQYVEPAQSMALKGAEMILMPIWDGYDVLMKARALENHVYLVACCYGNPSAIIDPEGRVLAEAKDEGIAVADIDLSQRPYATEWLGDMRGRFFKEKREELR